MSNPHNNPGYPAGNVIPFVIPPTPFRYDRNPVADTIIYAMHLQWSLRVLEAVCHELPAPDPQERAFVLPELTFDSFDMHGPDTDGRFGLRDLLLAVSFLFRSGFAETFRCDVPSGYEKALFVMPWAFREDAEAKEAAA